MTWRALAVAALAGVTFSWASLQLRDAPRMEKAVDVLRVRLPVPVQLANAAGDPFLAANLNVFRSLMVDARITEQETYRIQGQLQADVAIFNPRHEDNYYVAAAILPWNGQVDAAQRILLAAAETRDWDMWPAFFYAFNAMYFEHDMQRAGHWAEVAAQRDAHNAPALRAMAAKWYERGDDPQVALNILKAMHDQSRDENFRRLLLVRMERLKGLLALRKASDEFRVRTGRGAKELRELVGYGGLQAIPVDPMKLGYALSSEGQPQLVDHRVKRKQ